MRLSRALSFAVVGLLAAQAAADDVELVSGEVLRNASVRYEGLEVVVGHPLLGELRLSRNVVREVWSSFDIAEAAADAGGASGDAAGVAGAPSEPAPEWKWKAEIGATGSRGNVDNLDLRAAIQTLYESDRHRWKFEAAYSLAKTENVKTKNNLYVQGTKDWLFAESPWLVFATARYDRDEFQQWDQRASVGAGVGYRIVANDRSKVTARAGLSAVREYGVDDALDEDAGRWRPEGLLGIEASHKLTDAQSIEASVTYFPDLRDSGEYRVVATAAWSLLLSSEDKLHLKIGVADEYDTHRVDPFETNDFTWYVALLLEF